MTKVVNLSCFPDNDICNKYYSGVPVSLPEELKNSIIEEVNKYGSIVDSKIKKDLSNFCESEEVGIIALSGSIPMRSITLDKSDNYYVVIIEDSDLGKFMEGSTLYAEEQKWFEAVKLMEDPEIFKESILRLLRERLDEIGLR